MRDFVGFGFALSCLLGVLGCSSDEEHAPAPHADASATGGASSTGGKPSGGGGGAGGNSGAGGSGANRGTGGKSTDAGHAGNAGAGRDGGGADGSPSDGGGDAASGNTLTWDFTSNAEGWTGGFADYPSGEETFYELAFGHSAMPAAVGPGGGLKIGGNNHSDDLFMFVAKEITGLSPSTAYTMNIQVRIATNAPSDCAGIGGSPGTSVFFKIGTVGAAPVSAPADASATMQMNLDKGNQGSGGTDMELSGDIGNTKLCPDETYELKTFSATRTVTSDSSGRAWIVLGTDSGFEGTTVLYYDRVVVTVNPA